MTAVPAAADGRRPGSAAIALMVAIACLVPLAVFGNRAALAAVVGGGLLGAVRLGVRHPRLCWHLAVAGLPVTVAVAIPTTNATISVPLEILAAVLAPVLLAAVIRDPLKVSRLIGHPVTLAISFQLAWMAAATAFSADPVVSVKALAVRFVYVMVFYLGGFLVLDRALGGRAGDPLATATTAGLSLLVPATVWALANHLPSGFSRRDSYEIAQPFFSNHTEYATVLAVWLILAAGLRSNRPDRRRRAISLIMALLFAGVLVAGARSAWLALLAALAVVVALRFRPDPRRVVAIAAVTGLLLVGSIFGAAVVRDGPSLPDDPTVGDRIADRSAPDADLLDESFRERLTRWRSAARMLRDRPLFGFGPATFESTYGPYQQPRQLTHVSTYAGDRGDAHSELMTAAAEQGLGGLAALVAVIVLVFGSGVRAATDAATTRDRRWATAWTAAVAALVASSCFNSLLELDKTAPLFWLAAAVVVWLDHESSAAAATANRCSDQDQRSANSGSGQHPAPDHAGC
ncbi:MAG: O-antigen ligase family protein [Candidatus Sulfomarinibacteraceae bacterium]